MGAHRRPADRDLLAHQDDTAARGPSGSHRAGAFSRIRTAARRRRVCTASPTASRCSLLKIDRDVVLARPRDSHEWGMNPLLESMGMGYLSAVLRASGAAVEVVDNYFENLDAKRFLERLLEWRYPLLGVSISHQYPDMWPLF